MPRSAANKSLTGEVGQEVVLGIHLVTSVGFMSGRNKQRVNPNLALLTPSWSVPCCLTADSLKKSGILQAGVA